MTEDQRIRANFLRTRIKELEEWVKDYGKFKKGEETKYSVSIPRWSIYLVTPIIVTELEHLKREFISL